MSEFDKASRGELYNALSQECTMARERAAELLYDYNQLRPSDYSRRKHILSELIGSGGGGAFIVQPFFCDYGHNIHLGKNFFANTNLVILDGAEVRIGDNVLVAPNCGFYTAGHPEDITLRNAALEYAYPITIGNNVWIGANVTVLPGVTIGDNSIIGAGSVVTKDIPSNVLAVGNPCRPIRPIQASDREQ